MLALLGVGFLGGLITGISPCVVPVLPAVVAGSSMGEESDAKASRWRPYAIIGGLVVSFSIFTLIGGALLSALHLPQDLLRDLGIAALIVLAVALVWPRLGEVVERPFARLGAKRQATAGGSFVLGVSLGLVFVPCAGPVLAAISVVAATHRVGLTAVLLTIAYALGVTIPLLVLAVIAQRTTRGWRFARAHVQTVRRVAGAVLGLTAIAIALNLTGPLQTSVPGYTSSLENHVESTPSAARQLRALTGEHANNFARAEQVSAAGSLPNLGQAPNFTGITQWLNTPGDKPLSLASLRGHVVLVDFWTYSCINCQRSLPHVESWYRAYRREGFVVVGVHTPEFAFEHVISNVKAAASQLGVHYPIAIDNDYKTWNAYNNEYWPAEYLIDQNGNVRHTQFGEGDYGTTERDIRLLLAAGGAKHVPLAADVANRTPTEQTTPETYVGYERLQNVAGSIFPDKNTTYHLPSSVPQDELAFGGTWDDHAEEATAGAGAVMELNFQAEDVYLVLGGEGTINVSLNGTPIRTVHVGGVPGLYTLVSGSQLQQGLLRLNVSPGVQAYDFTFG